MDVLSGKQENINININEDFFNKAKYIKVLYRTKEIGCMHQHGTDELMVFSENKEKNKYWYVL